MVKIICENYDEMSAKAAELVAAEVKKKPNMVIGLATGSTPVGMYQNLIKAGVDFSGVTSYNLDEYYPIKKSNDQSYDYFMRKNLFDHIKIKETNIPNGEAADPAAECARYDAAVESAGGIDLQILGIGINGHVGFNEPGATLSVGTHYVELTESTIEANARFFENKNDVPRHALTLGMGGIMKAKKVLVLASGANKAQAIREMFSGKVTTNNPASLLQLHNDVVVIIDKAADGQ